MIWNGVNYRELSDGVLITPHRGTPPAIPAGYERMASDPYKFVLILDPCGYRTTQEVNSSCCGTEDMRYCNLLQKQVSRDKCKGCHENIPVESTAPNGQNEGVSEVEPGS